MRMCTTKGIVLTVLGVLFSIPGAFGAPMVTTAGSWSLTLSAADLSPASTAGADFFSSYDNINNPGSGGPTTVSAQTGSGPWHMYIQLTSGSLPSGVSLIARVYSPTSNPPIDLNNSPVTVDGTVRDFYRTTTTAAVQIQYEVTGVSIANVYSTSYAVVITYTVTN